MGGWCVGFSNPGRRLMDPTHCSATLGALMVPAPWVGLTRRTHIPDTRLHLATHPPSTHAPPIFTRRLLPALLHFGEPGGSAGAAGRAEALKYVRFAMQRLGSEDPAVHNLAVALLSQDPDQVSGPGWLERDLQCSCTASALRQFVLPGSWCSCTIGVLLLQTEEGLCNLCGYAACPRQTCPLPNPPRTAGGRAVGVLGLRPRPGGHPAVRCRACAAPGA